MELNKTRVTLDSLFAVCGTDETEATFSPDRRSIRIHGHSTTIRLERAFWESLERLADEEGTTIASLITSVHDHCPQMNTRNLASCLRVICLLTSNNDEQDED